MYVTSGLSEGELVCLSNISGAIAGTLVRTATITPTRKIEKPVVPEDVAPTESPLNIAPAPTAAPIEQEFKIPAPDINQDQQA